MHQRGPFRLQEPVFGSLYSWGPSGYDITLGESNDDREEDGSSINEKKNTILIQHNKYTYYEWTITTNELINTEQPLDNTLL